ncbi:MAG: UDP-N-acetylglucosamine 2-epimerase (non-hydrolyzing) [Candidatus Omnitrophica bacterium]|nr:UDP-N-acetylglucosamine 2-epimerase (non-hydrolyzing) [Candidatus Omnitrophota bacterium]
MKAIFVVGTRPNFIKIASIINVVNIQKKQNRGDIKYVLVHTGQHYDSKMSGEIFRKLSLPKPNFFLGIKSVSHAVQTAKIMIEFEKVAVKIQPDVVLVVGDVNSTFACSLTAAKLGIPVAHVEAGLRSFDMSMPEEINRILTDRISDYLFTTCEDANRNLKNEGVNPKKIFFVGNVMCDTLFSYRKKAENSEILEKLNLNQNKNITEYAVLTLHRPSNVDNKDVFVEILNGLRSVSKLLPIIFPVHPRTKKQIEVFKLQKYFNSLGATGTPRGICAIAPLNYIDFLRLTSKAKLVFTDSGGIQEETTILGIPCLTIRENTERPVTITEGTNELIGTRSDSIRTKALSVLKKGSRKFKVPKMWDGRAAGRIVEILTRKKQYF